MNELKIGERIAKLRETSGLTQAELAEKLGVTDRAVSKWETGGGYPDITLLAPIADVFGVSIDYLLRGTPQLRQKIEIFWGGDSRRIDGINQKYLDQGWRVESVTMAGDGGGGIAGVVVMAKECFSE